MNFKSLLFLTCLLSLYQISLSQVTGKIRVFAGQDSTIIKLGEEYLSVNKFYVVDTGTYEIKAWAPRREFTVKKVKVSEGSFKTLPFNLPYTNEYKAYRLDKVNYYFKKITLRYAVPAIYIVLANNYLSNINSYSDQAAEFEKSAITAKANYEQSIYRDELNLYKGSFNQYKNNYNDANDFVTQNRTRFVISTGAAVVLTYFGWKMAKKLKKPTYTEKRLLSDLSVSPIVTPNGTGVSLTLNL